MGATIFSALAFGMVSIAFLLQELVPPIPWAYDAVLFLVPVVFFSAAIMVPYPVMLALAFFTGFVADARHVVAELPTVAAGLPMSGTDAMSGLPGQTAPASAVAHLAFGHTIFLYGILGSLMQGIRPLFRRGRWELPVLMTGVATFLLLLLTYVVMEFRSGDFAFPETIWYFMLASALLSMVVSPLMFLLLDRLSRASKYKIRFEGLAYKALN
jgi:hypothetical protein